MPRGGSKIGRLGAGVVLAGVLWGSVGCGLLAGRETTNLPSLELTRLNGRSWNLQDETGQIVVLQFFATFDNSSLALATALERIHIRYQPRGVSVIGVAMDPGEGRPRRRVVEAFCALANLTFDVVLAIEEVGRGETELGDIPAIPATVVFDREGSPVASAVGPFREAELEALLDQLTASE